MVPVDREQPTPASEDYGTLEEQRMSTPPDDSEYRGPTIPPALGDQLQLVLDIPERPKVFADWVDALAQLVDQHDIVATPDVLCTTADSPHRARFNGTTQHYQCVQDPIILPFLAEEVDVVEIRTASPTDQRPIKLTVTETEVEADPSEAVFSFGVDADLQGPPDDGLSPAFAYGAFCPYGHAFPSEGAYETWAADVDAVTMVTSMRDTLEWARAMGGIAD